MNSKTEAVVDLAIATFITLYIALFVVVVVNTLVPNDPIVKPVVKSLNNECYLLVPNDNVINASKASQSSFDRFNQ